MANLGGDGSRRLFLPLMIAAVTQCAAEYEFPSEAQATADPQCRIDALRCCVFPMSSPEFSRCTRKIGCLPEKCLVKVESTTYGTYTSLSTTNNSIFYPRPTTVPPLQPDEKCERGSICCRFPPYTTEFSQCCEEHRCRPNCNQVPKGCCYNGYVWVWGSVVEVVGEACANLVCAAEKTDSPPYISARLVPVRRSDAGCTGYDYVGSKQLRCVDETGMMREEGEEFNIGKCLECECLAEGKVQCLKVTTKCLPLPTFTPRHCNVVEGPCCWSLNCSVERTCRDYNNKVQALYSTWKSDPCTTHKCTLGGIITKREPCPKKPHPNCMKEDELEEVGYAEEYADEEDEGKYECCPKWRCGPDCRLVRCSLVPPGEDCVEVYKPLACCPTWNCSGCVDDANEYHPIGSEWHPEPCTSLTCTPLGIVNTTVRCKPKPHEVCRVDYTQEDCCPVYDCGGCMDEYETFRPMFSKWKEAKCSFLTCTPRGIIPVEPSCPPKPSGNCREGPLDENCCPQWHCRPDCRTVRCAGPPQDGCTPYVPPLSCCPQWNCSACVDEKGRQRAVGSIWRTDDPCTNQTCTETGKVVSVSVSCALSSRPRKEGCFQYIPEGECCPQWNCSGCIDDNGVFYPIFQAWNTDACTKHFCDPSGIFTQVTQCPSLPLKPHPNCVEQVPPGECCPDWKCGPDCRLIFCVPRPEGDCTPYRPPLACCDQYTCSGCTDNTGGNRRIGHTWFTPPCFLHTCKKEGVVTYNLCEGDIPSYQTKRRRSAQLKNEPASSPERKEREEKAAAAMTEAPAPVLTPFPTAT